MEESDVLTRMTKGSRGGGNTSPKQEKKKQVCAKILRQLADDGHEVATKPGFAEELQAHFMRLPTRYPSPASPSPSLHFFLQAPIRRKRTNFIHVATLADGCLP
jgi:hypothetical protein